MTPDERDRLARLEAITANQDARLDKIDAKLDQLLAAANMGKGAWWAILKVGGFITMLIAAAAWVWRHLINGGSP